MKRIASLAAAALLLGLLPASAVQKTSAQYRGGVVLMDDDGNVISSTNPLPIGASAPSSDATAGVSPGAANSANNLVLKASAGNLYDVYLSATADSWLYVFNAVSAPSDGAVTAGASSGNYSECIKVPAGGTGSVAYASFPEVYSVGITAVISSTACGTLTKATTGFLHGRAK